MSRTLPEGFALGFQVWVTVSVLPPRLISWVTMTAVSQGTTAYW